MNCRVLRDAASRAANNLLADFDTRERELVKVQVSDLLALRAVLYEHRIC